MTTTHTTKGDVFGDLGFDKAESINLRVRSELMIALRSYINKNKLTQKQAAEIFQVDQPQISRLVSGKIQNFTVDKLLKMATYADIKASFKIAA